MTKKNISQIIFILAGIFTVIGAITKIINFAYAPYVFTLGTILLIISHMQMALASKDDDFRQRRLSRIGFAVSLLLLVSDYLMFTGSNAWVVFLLIYALSSFVLSFRSE